MRVPSKVCQPSIYIKSNKSPFFISSGNKRRFWDDLIDGGLKFTPLGKLDKSLFNSVRAEDRYFRKLSSQEPSWDYFSPF